MELEKYLDEVRKVNPLVHHITNYVTVNDCANGCLAIGGSPVMADACDEAADMASIASSVVLNMGTLKVAQVESMMIAGRKANERKIPVVFDPVGVGATPFRKRMAQEIMETVHMTVVRGNMSEILSLGGEDVRTKGVDASGTVDMEEALPIARKLAVKWNTVVVISGPTDIVTDGTRVVLVHNGSDKMPLITGSGCMCTTIIGAFCGANPENPFESAASAMISMGLAGERAWKQWEDSGLGHFHLGLIDELGKMTGKILEEGARYEEH